MKNPFEVSKEKAYDSSFWLRLISIASIIYFLYYLWWRATFSLNPQALFFSWLLLGAEAFGVFNYILFAWMTQNVSSNRRYTRPLSGLTVDIFVPTYNESLEILCQPPKFSTNHK